MTLMSSGRTRTSSLTGRTPKTIRLLIFPFVFVFVFDADAAPR